MPPSTTPDICTHAFDKNKKAASAGLQGMLEIWREYSYNAEDSLCGVHFPQRESFFAIGYLYPW